VSTRPEVMPLQTATGGSLRDRTVRALALLRRLERPSSALSKMSGPNGAALLDDAGRHLLGRSSNEFVVTDGEPARPCRTVRNALMDSLILRYIGPQAQMSSFSPSTVISAVLWIALGSTA
jgi:hypothetical protein